MKVACPSCGAENPLENPGEEVVCISCFSVWTPDASAVIEDTATPDAPESAAGEDTFDGSSIDIEPSNEEIDPLNLDLGVADADAEEATAFAMEAIPSAGEALTVPAEAAEEPADVESWADQTLVTDGSLEEGDEGTQSFDVGADPDEEVHTYTRGSSDIIQEESPFGDADGGGQAADIDALSRTTVAAAESSEGSTEVFGDAGSDPSASSPASDYDDPFADFESGSDSTSSYEDPFASSEAESGAATVSEDPFAADALSSSDGGDGGGLDGMEELDFGSLDGGDLPEGGFDVDAPLGEVDASGGDDPPMDLEGEDASDAGEAPSRGRRGRGRGRRRSKGSEGKAKQIAGLVVVVFVLVGVAAGQTEFGYFGINLILGDSGQAPSRQLPPRRAKENVAKPGGGTAVADAPADYAKQIAELEQKLKADPKNKELRHELARSLLSFQERHPSVYGQNPEYGKRLNEVLDPEQLKADKQLLIKKMLVEGKMEDAEAALEQLKADKISDPTELYLMAKIARKRGDDAAAIGHYKRALERNPTFEPALVDMAKIHLEKKEIAEAKALFEKLLEINPNHSEAQVEIAQIALYEKKYDEALALADKALATAQKTGAQDGIHGAYWLKARLAAAQGKTEEQKAALEQAVAARPKHEATVLALANFLARTGNNQAALVSLQAAETAGLKSPNFFRALIQALVAAGKEDEARKKLEAGLAAAPQDTGLLMLQAEEKIRTKHLKTAKAIFSQIIEVNPAFIDSYLGLSDLLVGEGRITEAITLLRGAVEKVDEKLPLLVKTAELQMQSGATLKARETMGQILKVDPNNVEVKLRFASLLKGLGIYDESVNYYSDLDTAGALKPDQTLDYAEVLNELGRRDVALRQVESVIASEPRNLRANILRGHLNTMKGEYRKAAEDLNRALKIQEDSGDALYFIGLNELAQERLDSAISFLNKASNVAPDDLRVRFSLAKAFTASGTQENRRSALAQYSYIIEKYDTYTSALERKQIDPEVYLLRGRLYFKANQHKKALADFKQAMVLDSGRQELMIEYARALQKSGNRGEADNYLREVLSGDESNPAAHYYLGESMLSSKNFKEAEKHFKRAVESGGADFPNAYRHLGFLFKDKGLKALACNSFKEYLRFAPQSAYDREEITRETRNLKCKK